ncbi:MAG: hypothetical protein GF401_03345, partial [Chitinivibrionales bacterium]|nr:hypothetical protein [Chitinivibrionales bacterium]
MVRSQGDTSSYIFEFQDSVQRRTFLSSFEDFVEQYPFDTIKTDTVDTYVKITIYPRLKKIVKGDSLMLSPVEEARFVESIIEAGADTVDTSALPEPGGAVSLYYHRDEIDSRIIHLIGASLTPSLKYAKINDSLFAGHVMLPEQVSDQRIRLSINPLLKNGKGEPLSAFDIVDAWNTFVKKYPSEGMALFRHVKGIGGLIRGEEAVIPGIRTIDDKTIMLHLQKPDPYAIHRLNCPFLLPPSTRLGPYYLIGRKNGVIGCMANKHYIAGRPFLDKCAIRLGGDSNPFLGYSMKRYDIITLYQTKDIAYARDKLLQESKLVRGWEDLYFLALGEESEELRKFLVSMVNPEELLKNFIQAEGHVIDALADTADINREKESEKLRQAPFTGSPLTILYNKGDPISGRLAEKLLADISHIGMPCRLDGRGGAEFEKALVSRDYSLAVGWAPADIRKSKCQQLRLAAIWFNDQINEQQRIAEYRELPLFS